MQRALIELRVQSSVLNKQVDKNAGYMFMTHATHTHHLPFKQYALILLLASFDQKKKNETEAQRGLITEKSHQPEVTVMEL